MIKKIINIISLLLLVVLAAGASYYIYGVQQHEAFLETQIMDINRQLEIANTKNAELQRIAKNRADEVAMELDNIALATSFTGANIGGYPITLAEGDWTVVVQAYSVEIDEEPIIPFLSTGGILSSPVPQEPVIEERLKLILSQWENGSMLESFEFEYPETNNISDVLEYKDK